MLAGKAPVDLNTLHFPLLASPKLDGIRCIIKDGVALSRKLLPIPNRYVQAQLKGLPDGLDGELMLDLPGSFNKVQSAVMSADGEPDFTFCVFDGHTKDREQGFWDRYRTLCNWATTEGQCWKRVEVVPHSILEDVAMVMALEGVFVSQGFEGIMLRSVNGPYKYGRSTEREQFLLKLKRFEDAEADVIGVEELMHNDNEATKNELGQTKRSSNKEGKRPAGKLGALKCMRDDCVKFDIGTGFTDAQRVEFWERRHEITGSITYPRVKYKFQPDPAAPDNAPRFPVFLGFRHEIDQ